MFLNGMDWLDDLGNVLQENNSAEQFTKDLVLVVVTDILTRHGSFLILGRRKQERKQQIWHIFESGSRGEAHVSI
jgi:hypothetical protein